MPLLDGCSSYGNRSFSSTMDKYRTISAICQGAGLLSGY